MGVPIFSKSARVPAWAEGESKSPVPENRAFLFFSVGAREN